MFIANLMQYLNASRLIKLGKLEQRELNRKEFEKKKELVDEIRNSTGNSNVKWLYPPNKPK